MSVEVQVLYENGPCLAAMKPPGVLTQAPPGIDSLEVRLKALLRQRRQKEGNIYLGVPHRLDRPASGAMLFGLHSRATRRLAEQFEGRLVQKIYWTMVEGMVQPEEGTWSDHVRKIPDRPHAEVVTEEHPDAKLAVLHYRTVRRERTFSLLEIRLETGRTHQVRIQAASRGHPVLGDHQYGASLPFGPHCDDPRDRAIALHARRLDFRHPMTREPVSVTAPEPECWQPFLCGQSAQGSYPNRTT